MDRYNIYGFIDFIIASSYLIFIFLSIQIWFLWKDIDKNELKLKKFFSDTFFKKNCIYLFSFSIFFITHKFFEEISLPNSMIYHQFFEMLSLISILLFTYQWYTALKTCASKKSLPQELISIT